MTTDHRLPTTDSLGFDGPSSRAELRDLDRHDPHRAWAAPPPLDLARAERILQRACHPGIKIDNRQSTTDND